MMKKLLVMALVLGLGAYASAGLEWVIEGSTGPTATKVNFGDDLTLTLMSTDGATGARIGLITDNGAAGMFTGSAIPDAWPNRASEGRKLGDLNAQLAGMGIPAIPGDDNDWAWIDAVSGGDVALGPVLVLNYTAGGVAEDVLVTATSASIGPLGTVPNIISFPSGPVEVPDLAFTVIPEPMTLALLGLGGLFLRRRK